MPTLPEEGDRDAIEGEAVCVEAFVANRNVAAIISITAILRIKIGELTSMVIPTEASAKLEPSPDRLLACLYFLSV
jgi:hypothetical protein